MGFGVPKPQPLYEEYMKQLLTFVFSSLLLTQAYADVACGPVKITHLEAQSVKVIFAIEGDAWTSGPRWKLLGPQKDEITKSYQAIAQQALASDSYIYLKFEDGHICGDNEYTQEPKMIRIIK